jgi:hypothetical protein
MKEGGSLISKLITVVRCRCRDKDIFGKEGEYTIKLTISPFTKSLFFSSVVLYLKPGCLANLSDSHLEINMGRPPRGSRSLFKAASASACNIYIIQSIKNTGVNAPINTHTSTGQ